MISDSKEGSREGSILVLLLLLSKSIDISSSAVVAELGEREGREVDEEVGLEFLDFGRLAVEDRIEGERVS